MCRARNMLFVETIMAQGAGYRLVVDARERELVSLFAGAIEFRTLDVADCPMRIRRRHIFGGRAEDRRRLLIVQNRTHSTLHLREVT